MRKAFLLASALPLLLAAACYRPDIRDGGFVCGADDQCPDGFICAADRRCRKSDECPANMPPVTPVCDLQPGEAEECNPACQTGCACGRCNVAGSASTCTVAGTKTLGQVCNPLADDCAAGLICLQEACGGGTLGRCYRHCDQSGQCPGTACVIPIQDGNGANTGYLTCDVPRQTCDPINRTGCPHADLRCYVASTDTLCDCPAGAKLENQTCSAYNECAAGLVCVATQTGGMTCRRLCRTDAGCPVTQQACEPLWTGSLYGYCGE